MFLRCDCHTACLFYVTSYALALLDLVVDCVTSVLSAQLHTSEQYHYEHAWITVVSSQNTSADGDVSDSSVTNKMTAIAMKITACSDVYIALSKYIGKTSSLLIR